MNYPIADTHTHLYFPAFDQSRTQAIQNAEKNEVKLQIQIGCDEISSLAALKLAKTREDYYATLGLHPCDVHLLGKPAPHRISGFENYKCQATNLEQLVTWFEQTFHQNPQKIVGFGETGFDFYHQDTSEIRELQKKAFLAHIELARKFDRALVMHTRSAKPETLAFLAEHKEQFDLPTQTEGLKKRIRGVIHCFSEDTAFAREVTETYGFFIGVGGVATYKNAEGVREAIKETPLEYLVTETDAPFLVPQVYRKKHKICESSFLDRVVELIADLKGKRVEAVAEVLFNNAKRLFGVK